jgi:hypothetical protein
MKLVASGDPEFKVFSKEYDNGVLEAVPGRHN